MTQLSPIFQKEIDAFDGNFMNNGVDGLLRDEFQDTRMLIIRKHFLESLQRASLAVVEESVGEKDDTINYSSVTNLTEQGILVNQEYYFSEHLLKNKFREATLATAKTITSPNTGTLQG